MTPLLINETFFSPQGEGHFTGEPTVFVRLFGCNLDCSWCDQPNALRTRPGASYRDSSDEEIAEYVCRYPVTVPVCFTGGEPTAQHEGLVAAIEEIRKLDGNSDRQITIETNGTIYIPKLPEKCFLSISPKFTGTFFNEALQAHGNAEIVSWLKDKKHTKQLKFVVESSAHFKGILKWAEKIPEGLRKGVSVYFQPEWFSKEKNQLREVFRAHASPEEWIKVSRLGFSSVRFTTQSHKYLAMR